LYLVKIQHLQLKIQPNTFSYSALRRATIGADTRTIASREPLNDMTTNKARQTTTVTRTRVVSALLALAGVARSAHAVKFGEDFTDTLKKKPEPLKGPTYAADFDGRQLLADDLSTMFMHGLTCGACMAVLNETKSLYDETVRTKFHHPDDVTGGAMYDYMSELTDPDEFCDGNKLGEKYGV